jgi:valyl-tRNA synthetase
VRTLRSECGITPEKKLRALVCVSAELEKPFNEYEQLIKLLAGIDELTIKPTASADTSSTQSPAGLNPPGSIGMTSSGFEVFVFVSEAVDIAALKKKFSNDLERDRKYIESLRAKLANEQFIKNAPAQLVIEQKLKLEETILRTEKFAGYFTSLTRDDK